MIRPLSVILDVALLPFDIVTDILDYGCATPKSKSDTRERIEKIEDNLRP